MKIKVRMFLTMKEATGGKSTLELELAHGTVISLLRDLGDRFGEDFISRVFEVEEGGLSGDILVLINGRNISSLPEGLDFPLEDGMEIAIFPPMTGGR